MKLSKNLSLSEVTKSNTAIRKGIDNSPTRKHLERLETTLKSLYTFHQVTEVKLLIRL